MARQPTGQVSGHVRLAKRKRGDRQPAGAVMARTGARPAPRSLQPFPFASTAARRRRYPTMIRSPAPSWCGEATPTPGIT